ncbi:MAG: hypothetical protein IIU14_06215 [Ruminococcus sp.]|nr:hypothetical protein [Ruminococcus sp.]
MIKKISALILALITAVFVTVFPVDAARYTPVSTFAALNEACITETGGRYELTADIPVSNTIMVNINARKPLYIRGNGHILYSQTDGPLFDFSNSRACIPHFTNIKFDGKNKSLSAVSTSPTSPAISMSFTDCEIKNFASNDDTGAVTLRNASSATFAGCTFSDNSAVPNSEKNGATGADVYSENTVGFTDCVLSDSVFVLGAQLTCENSGFASMFLDENSSLDSQGSTVTDLRAFSKSRDSITCDSFLLTRGYSDSAGLYTIGSTPEITNAVEDTNEFDLSFTSYASSQLLGVQLKREIAESVGTSAQETGRDLRFVAVANEGLIKGANISDYGFVAAKVSALPDDVYASPNIAGHLTVGNAKTISCKGTLNNLSGSYGDPEALTPYKYVTMCVNGIEDNSTVIVRFFVRTTDGSTIYSPYIKGNASYALIAANFSKMTGKYIP